MPRCAPLLWVLAAMAPGAIAVTDPAPGSTAAPPAPAGLSPAGPPPAAPAVSHGCLPTGNGYLRARIRGALNLDINWRNADIECDGGLRPDGSALRMSCAGPERARAHQPAGPQGPRLDAACPRRAQSLSPCCRRSRS